SKRKLLEHQRTALKNKNAVGEKQQRFLDSVIGFAETDMPRKIKTQFPTTENLQTMLEFLGNSLQNLTDKSVELKKQIEDLDREIAIVERQIKNLNKPKMAAQKVVEVLFESPEAQDLNIDVFYVAERALWEPVYKVDISLDLSRINLTMFARIQQKTGEHWENVKLSVSNAMPLKGAALPDIESWYLNLPCSNMAWAGAAADLGTAEALDGALESSLAEVVEEEVQAVQNELPLAFEYDLPQSINMDSGTTETLLPLSTREMKGDFFIYAIPKKDPLSYLVCRSTADGALLAGKLNVHFGGRFVGGTLLEEKTAGEDFLINLGVERGVKIRREKITDKLTETFFGKVDRSSVAREMEYRIVMENLKDEAVQVRMMDSIPVSKTDRIQIKDVEAVPKPSVNDYQEQEGVMRWDIDLKPRAVEDIRIKFFVKHPKNNPPWGL
ncbi:MAG: mucoidy inhibitor MuiA family protein, partial [Planctomycetota bacterium]